MTTEPIIPEHLLDSIRSGNCIGFVGSGLSIPSGLPSWSQLISLLIEEVRRIDPTKGVEFQQQVEMGHLLQVAQYAKAELGESAYFDVLIRCYRHGERHHSNHDLVTQIPFRGLITTNYDKLIETAFTLQKAEIPICFTPLSTSALASVLFSKRYFIFKLHGDIDYPESIILTKQDYTRILFSSPHVKTFIQSLFSQNTVLFIGYSLNDPDFDLLLTELTEIFAGSTPPHYAILPNPDPMKVHDLKSRLNVRAISYDPAEDHKQLSIILGTIEKETRIGRRGK